MGMSVRVMCEVVYGSSHAYLLMQLPRQSRSFGITRHAVLSGPDGPVRAVPTNANLCCLTRSRETLQTTGQVGVCG